MFQKISAPPPLPNLSLRVLCLEQKLARGWGFMILFFQQQAHMVEVVLAWLAAVGRFVDSVGAVEAEVESRAVHQSEQCLGEHGRA